MIYFIQAETGQIKIGYTNIAVSRRLSELQTGCPIELKLLHHAEGTFRLEEQLHETFRHLRIRGEWFKPGQDLLDFIEAQRDSSERLLPAKRPGRKLHQIPSGPIKCRDCQHNLVMVCAHCNRIIRKKRNNGDSAVN